MSTGLVAQFAKMNECPESGLERYLVAEYILSKGYGRSDLLKLPVEQRKALMRAACLYASVKLANIEARSKFRRKIEMP